MKKFLLQLFALFLVSMNLDAQIFSENFEGGVLPDGWTNQSQATDGGFLVGPAGALGSQFFNIPDNGSNGMVATNDDACNCDKNEERLIMPKLDLTGYEIITLNFDAYYEDNTYQGNMENATVLISTDSTNWTELSDLDSKDWERVSIDISDYAGEASVYIAFGYSDGTGWLYGFAIDNVSVEEPLGLDANLTEVTGREFGEEDTELPIGGTIVNEGAMDITSLVISYSIDGGTPIEETFDDINIPAFTSSTFAFSSPWVPDTEGEYTIDVNIESVNGMFDENPLNNSQSFDTKIFVKVVPPNKVDEFILAEPIFTEMANVSNELDKPTDLDFFPIMGKDELWVINERTENAGGSTVTIANASAGPSPEDYWQRVDGNAWHFMSLPTGIAFSSDNFNFASSPGVQDANHGGGTFTGPTLWSSDPEIYAQPSGGNGSHLDMLHGSPFSMGIAHEVDNAFWIYDDWNEDIVRYDFVEDHGPGAADHSDGRVRRYSGIGINADADIPNHMILDKETGWLYFVDNGNDRVVRLDINSGGIGSALPLINEPLAEHSSMSNFTTEVIIDTGLDRPCGIEIMENRLMVGDYATGEIIVYDMDNNFMELGRIATGETGLTGIKIGPLGNIWFTNRLQNTLYKMEPGEINNTEEQAIVDQINVFPNPTDGKLSINIPFYGFTSELNIEVRDLTGKLLLTSNGNIGLQQFDLSHLSSGMYLVSISTDEVATTRKIVLR